MVEERSWTERRKYTRARARTEVRYRIVSGQDPSRISSTVRAVLVNIGGGGILLGVQDLLTDHLHMSFNQDMRVQNWLALEIDLVPGRPPIRALGKVAWYQRAIPGGEYLYNVGIEFKEIRDEDRNSVVEFVNRCQGDRSP